VTGEDAAAEVPTVFELLPNRPNPFNTATTIRYVLNEPGPVRLTVHDTIGRKVRILEDGYKIAGAHEIVWDGCDESGNPAASGVYICRMESGGKVQAMGMTLVR